MTGFILSLILVKGSVLKNEGAFFIFLLHDTFTINSIFYVVYHTTDNYSPYRA